MSRLKDTVKLSILSIGALIHRNHKSKLLYYHDVHGDTQYTPMGTDWKLFAQHLDTIRQEGFQIVPHIKEADGEVALLFDDGFRGIYDCRELFYEQHICPKVFLAVSLIGQPGYLTKEEILNLQQHGFIFESHGWSHADMTQFSDKGLDKELWGARQHLSNLLGKEVTELCLPIGYYSTHVIEKAIESGYTTIYSSVPGDYEDLVERMRRRNLLQFSTPKEVKMILRGGNSLLRKHYMKLHKRR